MQDLWVYVQDYQQPIQSLRVNLYQPVFLYPLTNGSVHVKYLTILYFFNYKFNCTI